MLRSLLIPLVAVVVCGCVRSAQPVPVVGPGGGGSPCASGAPKEHDRSAPIVCVDDSGATLRVSPDPVVVHDVGASTSAPVVLQWFTHSGTGNLQLEIAPGCVTDLQCNGRGHCTAKTRNITGADVRCKYDVWTDTHPRLDPDIIVTECC
jgi:hypothetical protein